MLSPDMLQVIDAVAKTSMIIMVGLYFVFSNTIMGSLKNLDTPDSKGRGAEVMVEINSVILNPVFMGCFILSAISSVYFVITDHGLMPLSGAVFFVGTTLVTMIKNVPLNNRLRDASDSASSEVVWQVYLDKWVFWNHVRSISAVISGFLMVL